MTWSETITRAVLAATAIGGWVTVGCGPETSPAPPARPAAAPAGGAHDHDDSHDHPATLAAGVASLEKLLADVSARVGSGALDEADDAIHEAGHLVDELRGLVDSAPDLAAEAKADVKRALDDVFAAVEELHEPFHAAEPKKEDVTKAYEAIRERLDAALGTLRDRAGGTTKEAK